MESLAEEFQRDAELMQLTLNQEERPWWQMIDEYEGSSVGGPSQAEAAAQSASHAGSLPDYPVAMGESAEEEDEVGDEDDADSDDDSLDLENLPATVENCLALNQAYQEVLDQIIEKLDSTVATNREQQQHLQEQLDHCSGDPDVRVVTKVPVQMYLPPYFKDTANMYPPPNADTIRKAHSGEFDPLVEVPKRWSVSEKEKLLNGVRQSLMEIRLKPLENRKDIVKEKLASDTRQSEEKKELRKKLKELEFEIEQICNLPDEQLLMPPYDDIDWLLISNNDLKGTRTTIECQLFWMNEMRPGLNQKSEWTAAEQKKLRNLVKNYESRNAKVDWDEVSEAMAGHGRTAFQCFEKYQSESVMENLRRKKWTEEEDNRLKQIVDSCRVGNYISWDQVGYLFEGRTRMQCQLRYTRVLDSNLRKGRWSEEEDLLLIAGVKKYGPKDWYKVAEFVKGRTDTQCRERWVGCLDAGLKMGVWTKEEDKKLMYGVRMFGVGSWAKISRLIDGRTPSACKIRHKTLTHTRKHYPRVREAAEVKLTKKGEPMKKRGPKGRSDKTIPFEVRLERCTALIEKSRSRKQNLMRIFNELGCEMPQSVHKTPTEFLDSDVPANVRAAFKQKLAEIHAKYGDFEREIIEAKQKEITSRANSSLGGGISPSEAVAHRKIEDQIRRLMVKHHQNKLEFNAEQDQNCRELLKIAVEKAKVLPPTLTTCRGYKNFLLNRNSITTMAKNLVAPANANKSSNKDSLQVETSETQSSVVETSEPSTSAKSDNSKLTRFRGTAEVMQTDEFTRFYRRCRGLFLWPAMAANTKLPTE